MPFDPLEQTKTPAVEDIASNKFHVKLALS